MKTPTVYIVTNKRNGTLYTGVTSNLQQRIYQHQNAVFDGFAKKYGCKYLVYYKNCNDMSSAIIREKQIKAGSRKQKMDLIESKNTNWIDLAEDIFK